MAETGSEDSLAEREDTNPQDRRGENLQAGGSENMETTQSQSGENPSELSSESSQIQGVASQSRGRDNVVTSHSGENSSDLSSESSQGQGGASQSRGTHVSQESQPLNSQDSQASLVILPSRLPNVGGNFLFDDRRKTDEATEPDDEPPPRQKLPSEQLPVVSDPTNPMRPQIVREWIAIFQYYGRTGLQNAFYEYAEHQLVSLKANPPKLPIEYTAEKESWGSLIQDRDGRTNHVLKLLLLLPDNVILALLRNELPRKIQDDSEIKTFVEKHMKLTEGMGIYGNFLHDNDFNWLSSRDMSSLLDKTKEYIANGPTTTPSAHQSQIDNFYGLWTSSKGLRFAQTSRAVDIIQAWIDQARERYCTNPIDPDAPFTMGVSEVGWAAQVEERARQHESNSSTTYVFGLLNAIGQMKRPNGFALAKPMQLILFPIWERNENLCRVGEKTGSLLTSSYTWLGGANSWPAGTMKFKDKDPEDPKSKAPSPPDSTDHRWGYNVRLVCHRLDTLNTVTQEEQRLARLAEERKERKERSKQAAETELVKLRKEIQEVDLAGLKAEIDTLQASIAAMKQQLTGPDKSKAANISFSLKERLEMYKMQRRREEQEYTMQRRREEQED